MSNIFQNDRLTGGLEPLWLPWEGRAPRIILASSCVMRRNLDGILFPPFQGKEEQARYVFEMIKNALSNHPEYDFLLRMQITDLSPYLKHLFNFIGLAPIEFLSAADYRAICMTPDYHAVLRINDRDHLTVMKSASGLSINELTAETNDIVTSYGMDLTYARDDYFGYLCSKAEHCGTGFSATVYMNLPATILMGYAEQIANAAEEIGFNLSYVQKQKQSFVTHIATVTAANLPHCSPMQISARLNDFARRLEKHELDSRAKLLSNKESLTNLQDIIGRSLGLIAGSCKLSTREAVKALCILWAGTEFGIRNFSITRKNYFKLLTTMMLQDKIEEEKLQDTPISITPEERATLLKTTLKLMV
ncbi:MAG: hypothetical protein J6X55_13030 [Victivallales bacterium]|nr:hypothetical protein [Victivallales bacterium]